MTDERTERRGTATDGGALMTDTQRFLLLSVVIGLMSGVVVTVFHIAIESATWMTTDWSAPTLLRVVLPGVGAWLSWVAVRRVWPAAAGSGVNDTKSAIYILDGYVPSGAVAGKFVACVLSIGTGTPLGPEDPALHIGAGLASLCGRRLGLTRERMRLVAPVGAAAGIAAAFNTPITAVLFVTEEVLAGWNASVLGSIVLAAVSATVVTRAFLGDAPLFEVPGFTLTHPSELAIYAAMGLLSGLLGAAALQVLVRLRAYARRLPPVWAPLLPFAAGLGVGVVGLSLPWVLGTGYPAVDSALHNEFPWALMLALSAARALLVAGSFAAGTPGGLFAPTLFVGAMFGGGIGGLAHEIWPAPTSAVSAYVLVGMGTFFAAFFRTPMTSIFMVFEVSATYTIMLPVMIANTVAYLVSRALQPSGIFDLISAQDGVVLPAVDEQRERVPRRVEDLMETVHHVVRLDGSDRWPLDPDWRLTTTDHPWLVRLASGTWVWLSPPAALEAFSKAPSAWVADAPLAPVTPLHPDDPSDVALSRLSSAPLLPVVSRARDGRLVGVVTIQGLLRSYGVESTPAAGGIARTA